MEIRYIKENFNLLEFIDEIGSLSTKISGFKHEGSTLTVYLSQEMTSQEKQDLASFVNDHQGIAKIKFTPVSARQIRTALLVSGLSIDAIEAGLDSLEEPTRSIAKVAWDFSNEYYRDNPLIESLAPVLGLTGQQLDDLWVLAKTL